MTSQTFVTLPREVVEQAIESLGSFVSDHGWAQSDMDTMDTLIAALTTQVQPAQSKGLFIDLIAAEGPEFVAEVAAIGCTQPAQGGLEDLLEKYWGLAYSEGKTGVMRGNEANEVLCKIRDLLQSNSEPVPLTPAQRVDIADACANLDYDDNFLGDLGKIIDLVESAHGITKGQQ